MKKLTHMMIRSLSGIPEVVDQNKELIKKIVLINEGVGNRIHRQLISLFQIAEKERPAIQTERKNKEYASESTNLHFSCLYIHG